MNLKICFEKYHHLDHLLSDSDWLKLRDEAGNESVLNNILFDCWQAIKTELQTDKRGQQKIQASPFRSCDDCMWNYEGECNISSHSGFQYDDDRYADDEDEHEFKPCKYRLEYFSFEEWFLEHYMELLK